MDNRKGRLTAETYDERYYREYAAAGLDYLGHGYWQEQYALMVGEATRQKGYERPFILDGEATEPGALFRY